MTVERSQEYTGLLAEEELQQATDMTTWFPEYLFGIQEEPGAIPPLTTRRLVRQFGRSHADGLRLLCDEIPMLPGEVQPDVAAYICGFPRGDLDAMMQIEYDALLEIIDERFPPPPPLTVYRPTKRRREEADVPLRTPKLFELTPKEVLPESLSPVNMPWQDDALCAQVDPEMFFPEKGGSTREAKKVCSNCSAKQECLAYALKNDERFGIWGGLSERERRKLKKPTERQASIDDWASN